MPDYVPRPSRTSDNRRAGRSPRLRTWGNNTLPLVRALHQSKRDARAHDAHDYDAHDWSRDPPGDWRRVCHRDRASHRPVLICVDDASYPADGPAVVILHFFLDGPSARLLAGASEAVIPAASAAKNLQPLAQCSAGAMQRDVQRRD